MTHMTHAEDVAQLRADIIELAGRLDAMRHVPAADDPDFLPPDDPRRKAAEAEREEFSMNLAYQLQGLFCQTTAAKWGGVLYQGSLYIPMERPDGCLYTLQLPIDQCVSLDERKPFTGLRVIVFPDGEGG